MIWSIRNQMQNVTNMIVIISHAMHVNVMFHFHLLCYEHAWLYAWHVFCRNDDDWSLARRPGVPSGHTDQSSWRLQVDWKHEDVLKTSWCLHQGYVTIKWNILEPPWWRLQHVMFIRQQEDHPKTSPHDVCNWTGSMHMSWRRLDAFFGLCHYQIKYFKAPLVTSSTRHVHKTTIRPPEDQSSWRLQVDLKHACVMRSLRLWSSYEIKYVKPSWICLQNVIFMQEDQIGSYYKLI